MSALPLRGGMEAVQSSGSLPSVDACSKAPKTCSTSSTTGPKTNKVVNATKLTPSKPNAVNNKQPVASKAAPATVSESRKSNQNGSNAPTSGRPKVSKPITNSVKRGRMQADGAVEKYKAPPAKRVRTTALQREAPKATSNARIPEGQFTSQSTIYLIRLGSGPLAPRFHVHETELMKSPRFQIEIAKAKSCKRPASQNVINLPAHDETAFDQMIDYLYKRDIKRSKIGTSVKSKAKNYIELFSLSKHYQLRDLQRLVIKMFSTSKILMKMTPSHFFDWAEDMYHNELDHKEGPFSNCFARVAPMVLAAGISEELVAEIDRVTAQGGGLSVLLFRTALEAMKMRPAIEAKKEPGIKDEHGQVT